MSDTGRLIAGRYRILDRIGRGGMATVWRAHDDLLDRQVAVKKLHPQPQLDADELATLFERTRREARSAARISHPNVVIVHDVVDDEGLPVIVMEYVPSTTFADLIKAQGPVPLGEVARVGRGVIAALRAAHRAGILHRDVKPANVLLAQTGRVVLTDFGIAQATETSNLTRTGQLVGSVDFMAPERLVGAKPGPEADLWALGATLYQAIDGHSPYLRNTVAETMYAIAMEPPPEVRGAGPLTPLIKGLLAAKPAERLSAEDAERLLRTTDVNPRRIRRVGHATPPPAGGVVPAAAPAPAAAVAKPEPGSELALRSQAAPSPMSAPGSELVPSPRPKPELEPEPSAELVPSPQPAPKPEPKSGNRASEASAADPAAAAAAAPAAERPKPSATTDPQASQPSGRTGRKRGKGRTPRTGRPKQLIALAAVVVTTVLITIAFVVDTTTEKNAGGATTSTDPLPAGGITSSRSAGTPTASPTGSPSPSPTNSGAKSPTARNPSQESTPQAGQQGDPDTESGDEDASTNSGSGSSVGAPDTDSSVAPTGHTLVVPATEKCLSGGAGTEGIQLVHVTCDGSTGQQWLIGSDGTFRALGKCMTVAGGSSEDRTEIQLTGCSGDSSQRFHFSGTQLLADQSQKCVTVFGGTSGTVVVLWECDDGWDNQIWTIR
ncbi:protein kinase domain-containing protein [Streptomyces sp. GQFP]|uniref:protein kinase domain-containing protein n=1 Tax=Streptomyces sp. GQFP TaxID=2907545 RepID=UPI001F19C2AD|nr:protein kinase [Streptomyces sp. GQFP]UIX32190.1 protein kinase [Streptomyces sp. GQFP]